MAYTYQTLVAALETNAVQLDSDTNWQSILPTIIDQAEQRIYRDLNLVSTVMRDTSGSLSANSRNFTLPQAFGRFVTVKGMNYFTSSGGLSSGRVQLRPVSLHFIDATWPSESSVSPSSVPQYFAYVTDQQYVLAPAPGSTLTIEVVGTVRPAPLTASNATDFLSLYLSDLLFAACMSAASAYMRDYGSQADDPKLAMSWETQYQMRLASANKEEMMRKYQSGDWTSESRPAPMATQG